MKSDESNVQKSRRPWLRLSLKALLIVTVPACGYFAWLGARYRQATAALNYNCTPMELLDFLKDDWDAEPPSTRRGLTLKPAPNNWMTPGDVRQLLEIVADETPCHAVNNWLSSYRLRDSTVGAEAKRLLHGFCIGYYPPPPAALMPDEEFLLEMVERQIRSPSSTWDVELQNEMSQRAIMRFRDASASES